MAALAQAQLTGRTRESPRLPPSLARRPTVPVVTDSVLSSSTRLLLRVRRVPCPDSEYSSPGPGSTTSDWQVTESASADGPLTAGSGSPSQPVPGVRRPGSACGGLSDRPRHAGLEVYSVFPFWHARTGQKRNSNDTLQSIEILPGLLKLGPAQCCYSDRARHDLTEMDARGHEKIINEA